MLSLITQDKNKKIDVKVYYIQYYDVFDLERVAIYGIEETNNDPILLGLYANEDKAEKVFKSMVKAEEEQNSITEYEKVVCSLNLSLKGTNILNSQNSSIEIPTLVKKFKIFKMPK